MTIEQQLLRHLRDTRFEHLDEKTLDAARREVLWALGTTVAGAADKGSDLVLAFVRQTGGPGEATVLGFGDRAPAPMAGFANGCFAKALEYEDKFWMDKGHGFA